MPELIPGWAVFAVPGLGVLFARGRLLEYVASEADSYGVNPARARRVVTIGVTVVSITFILMGAIQFLGGVPHALCLYSFSPMRWPVIATWLATLVMWGVVFGWVWLGPPQEVELVLSGLLPRASVTVYRVGIVLFVVGTLGMTLAMPLDAVPCVWLD